MLHQAKGTAVNRPLEVVGQGGGGAVLCRPVSRSQSLSEPLVLKLQCFPVSLELGGTGWL